MSTLRERFIGLFSKSETEEVLQEGLGNVVRDARRAAQTARNARKIGHIEANKNIAKGLVYDSYREHALVDFHTGLFEDEALRMKKEAQEVLLVRRALRSSHQDQGRQYQRLERMGIV